MEEENEGLFGQIDGELDNVAAALGGNNPDSPFNVALVTVGGVVSQASDELNNVSTALGGNNEGSVTNVALVVGGNALAMATDALGDPFGFFGGYESDVTEISETTPAEIPNAGQAYANELVSELTKAPESNPDEENPTEPPPTSPPPTSQPTQSPVEMITGALEENELPVPGEGGDEQTSNLSVGPESTANSIDTLAVSALYEGVDLSFTSVGFVLNETGNGLRMENPGQAPDPAALTGKVDGLSSVVTDGVSEFGEIDPNSFAVQDEGGTAVSAVIVSGYISNSPDPQGTGVVVPYENITSGFSETVAPGGEPRLGDPDIALFEGLDFVLAESKTGLISAVFDLALDSPPSFIDEIIVGDGDTDNNNGSTDYVDENSGLVDLATTPGGSDPQEIEIGVDTVFGLLGASPEDVTTTVSETNQDLVEMIEGGPDSAISTLTEAAQDQGIAI